MTLQERLIFLRKELKLSQEKFGETVGLKKSAISLIESGRNSPTDQFIKSVCREFDIKEEWLINGTGEMYVQRSRSEVIAKFAGDLMKDEEESFRRRLIEALAELNVEEWKLLEKIARRVFIKD